MIIEGEDGARARICDLCDFTVICEGVIKKDTEPCEEDADICQECYRRIVYNVSVLDNDLLRKIVCIMLEYPGDKLGFEREQRKTQIFGSWARKHE